RVHPQEAHRPHRPAHEPAQDVATALVRGPYAVGQQHERGAHMVRDDPEAHVVLGIRAVPATGELDGAVEHRADLIDLVHVLDALLEEGDALEAHPGVDVLLRELPDDVELGLASDVLHEVLHEHEVPDLQEPRVVDGGTAILAVVRPTVEEDLGVGAAGTRLTGVPVVVGAAEALDPLRLEPDDVPPDGLGLVVGLEDGDPQIFLVEPEAAIGLRRCQQFPGIPDRAFLEVVTERPVAQHLEERAVARGATDLFDVVRTDALLHVGDARMRRGHDPGEVRDERDHPRDREQQSRIVADQGRRGDDDVVVLLEVGEIALRDFRGLHRGTRVPCVRSEDPARPDRRVSGLGSVLGHGPGGREPRLLLAEGVAEDAGELADARV
ncbi:hypothetical protein ABE10_00535, partial [Bacillus toyonensis]|nr:hypothetical protein [Bacillus toyonensis]